MVVIVVLFYIIIGGIEIFTLIKNNKEKEVILYSITFTISFIISILLALGVKIPSPAKPIEKIVKAIIGE